MKWHNFQVPWTHSLPRIICWWGICMKNNVLLLAVKIHRSSQETSLPLVHDSALFLCSDLMRSSSGAVVAFYSHNSICSAQPSQSGGKPQQCHLKHSSCDSSPWQMPLCPEPDVRTPCWVSVGHSWFQGKITYYKKVEFTASLRVKAVEAKHKAKWAHSGWFSIWKGFCLSLLTPESVYNDSILLLAASDKHPEPPLHLSHRCLCSALLLQSQIIWYTTPWPFKTMKTSYSKRWKNPRFWSTLVKDIPGKTIQI